MLAHHFDIVRSVSILALVTLFLATNPTQARQTDESEPTLGSLSQPKQNQPLPLGTLLDSDGKPINIPNQPQSAFEYSAPTVTSTEIQKNQTTKPTKTSKSKKLTRKQQLASRVQVANDPNCRWLDKRMDQLEALSSGKQNKPAQYQIDELSARQKEWQCLKCGAEGPDQNDYSRCQYRRETITR
ncbi:hypothetical protein L2744_19995 [Shewanella profunda]|uniref:hypothetical protein n=1 Tax=Shewanella profunda TaxID=254793 RepID=UPI00200C8279|nr:hypothetical protein [Shewanella profunda]MCL1091846.1 hypothetical protein [Shewanella profunda]